MAKSDLYQKLDAIRKHVNQNPSNPLFDMILDFLDNLTDEYYNHYHSVNDPTDDNKYYPNTIETTSPKG